MQRTAPALDDDDVGIIVPENDVEEGPSVVRVDATPSTAESDDVRFGVRQLDKLGNNQWCCGAPYKACAKRSHQ